MKEAYIDKDLNVEIREVPVPAAGPGELLIHTIVSGTNPKDWKMPKSMGGDPASHGDDIASYVEAVGEGVTGLRPGDRVAAFHQMFTPHGSYAEYSVAAAKSAPNATTLEGIGLFFPLACMIYAFLLSGTYTDGATIPLAGKCLLLAQPTQI